LGDWYCCGLPRPSSRSLRHTVRGGARQHQEFFSSPSLLSQPGRRWETVSVGPFSGKESVPLWSAQKLAGCDIRCNGPAYAVSAAVNYFQITIVHKAGVKNNHSDCYEKTPTVKIRADY
jgi:hypothetical protein